MKFYFIVFSILLCLYLNVTLSAQSSSSTEIKTFEKDGLKFDYPIDWTLIDKSSANAQHLILSKESITTLFIIVAPRVVLESNKLFEKIQLDLDNAYRNGSKKNRYFRTNPAAS